VTAFSDALDFVLREEGPYSHHRDDPGGETVWGISRRAHPYWVGWRMVEKAQAANHLEDELQSEVLMGYVDELYRRHYWDACRCSELPPHGAIIVFDMAVNMGCDRATRLLQEALGVHVDGIIGPITREAAIAATDQHWLDVLERRLDAYHHMANWPVFGRGWTRRVLRLAVHAMPRRVA